MKKLRVGVVGLGHRGRLMCKLTAEFERVELVAACEINPNNWYKTQWRSTAPMAETFPDAVLYEDYDNMLNEGGMSAALAQGCMRRNLSRMICNALSSRQNPV